jgi:hypothetical protein
VHTARPQDWSPPFNQAEVWLLPETADLSVSVAVDTATPDFDTFMVREGEGEWTERPLAA